MTPEQQKNQHHGNQSEDKERDRSHTRRNDLRREERRAHKEAKLTEEEERLRDSIRRRNLKEAKQKERDDRRRSREAYRETHPGFYDSTRRLHSVLAVLLALLSLFFFASLLFRDSVGIIGGFLADILLGGFSFTAFLVPLFMMVHAIFWRTDVRDRRLVKKAIAFVPTLFFASACVAMLSPGFAPEPLHANVAYMNGVALRGGGVIGEFIARTLCSLIGGVGLWLIALSIFVFFLALYFRTLIKRLYIAARDSIKEALVERAKRRAAAKEAAKNPPADKQPPRRRDEPNPPPAHDDNLPLEKPAKEEPALNRRRALFNDLEDDLDTEPNRPNGGSRGRHLFDYDENEDTPPLSSPRGNREEDPFSPPFDREPKSTAAGNADFSADRLTVTRERIRPVRVSQPIDETDTPLPPENDPPAPAPEKPKKGGLFHREPLPTEEEEEDRTSMEYFRKITVAATSEEEELSPIAPRRVTTQMPRATEPPKPQEPKPMFEGSADFFSPKAPPLSDFDSYDSFSDDADDDEDLDIEEPITQMPRRTAPAPAPAPEKTAPPKKEAPRPAPAAKPTPPPPPKKPPYRYPPLSLLAPPEIVDENSIAAEVRSNAEKLVTTLDNFKVRTQVTGYSRGPRITRYELVPEAGVRVRTIAGLVEDISMSLATSGIRIEAPIPGKSAVGVEVPNTTSTLVRLRGLLDTPKFREASEKTLVCLGSDVAGQPVYCDLAKMPHMLVAGATGMGKSVCINSIITSILYKATPDEVKLIMIDPKQVEFGIYSGIPHLLVPVVTDPKKAAGALSWAVTEMERRFTLIKDAGVRDIKSYNREMAETGGEQLAKIVIIIDELHDLMMSAADAVETSIARIAAKARAAGIHLLIGTQRPSVDVITGTIKANIPSRIAFHVSSNVDSRTILDFVGAEKLLTQGDMLFNPAGAPKPHRVQGAFVDDKEIDRIVAFLKENNPVDEEAGEQIMADIEREAEKCMPQKKNADEDAGGGENVPTDYDDQHLLWAALEVGFEFSRLSTSLLQRKLKIGYGKAAKILDELYERDYITAPQGSKPREIRITREEFKELMAREVQEVCGNDF